MNAKTLSKALNSLAIDDFVFFFLGCPDRKGADSLQHVWRLHCSGGALHARQALRGQRG